MKISNTVKDVSRAVAAVDTNASAGIGDIPPGMDDTMGDLLARVANNFAYQLARTGVSHRTVSDEHVVAMLSAHGASYFTVETWTAYIADIVRNNQTLGGWGTQTAAVIARASRDAADMLAGDQP